MKQFTAFLFFCILFALTNTVYDILGKSSDSTGSEVMNKMTLNI